MSERYQKSEEYLVRAEKVIPLGSQTFSKSRTQFPHGVSPYFIEKAQGSRVWDVDGNKYVDCTHTVEKGCAVLEAVENNIIDESQYENYIKLKKESEHFERSYLENRKRDKDFGKMVREVKKIKGMRK